MTVQSARPPMEAVGNYDLVDLIAEGGMGAVYRGRKRDTGETVAVKILASHMLSNPVQVRRFEQEYNVARAVDHPNVVKALDFGRDGTTPYLVMEYVEGESLGQKIEREGAMSEADAIEMVRQVAEGLYKAHQLGLIHRDVKPDNVLVTRDGVAKLTDLGLAKEIDADLNLTRTGRGLGTPHFMAPEQFRNAKKADARCDIYSLAATLYMLVTGQLPFKSNGPLDAWMKKVNNQLVPPRDLLPSLSDRLDWAIRRGMSPDPAQRPASCREFVDDLIGHSTRRLCDTSPSVDLEAQTWYVLDGTLDGAAAHPMKATTETIRRSLQDGHLGAGGEVRLSRTPTGPFELVRSFPEFRDLVVQPAVLPQAPARPAAPTPTIAPPAPTRPRVAAPTASGLRIDAPPAEEESELWKWVAVITLATSTGVIGYLAVPVLSRLRLF